VNEAKCVCSADLELTRGFSVTPLIFSDLRDFQWRAEVLVCICGIVQKKLSHQYFSQLEEYYCNYAASRESKTVKSPLPVLEFGSKHESISEWILREITNDKTKSANFLDWGCGNLNLLTQIKEINKHVKLKLFGYDKYTSPINVSEFSGITLLTRVTDTKLQDLKFDYISLIHTLEHVTNIEEELASILFVLEDDGKVFIQVPNLAKNLYDLYVADHVFHFTPESLSNVLSSQGFKILKMDTSISQKEISVVAKRKSDVSMKDDKKDRVFNNDLEMNSRVLKKCWVSALKNLNDKKGLAIYGVGIAGSWIYRLSRDLGIEVSFFIDDNENSTNYTFNDIPIITIESLREDKNVQTVLIPFDTTLAIKKSKELKQIGISSIFFNSYSHSVEVCHTESGI